MWLCHHPLCGVDSVYLQILLMGNVSTMWFVIYRWPQSQEGDWTRPHLCKLARRGPWPVQKRFIRDHVWRGRSKPGCRIVGSVTIENGRWLVATPVELFDWQVRYLEYLVIYYLRCALLGCVSTTLTSCFSGWSHRYAIDNWLMPNFYWKNSVKLLVSILQKWITRVKICSYETFFRLILLFFYASECWC